MSELPQAFRERMERLLGDEYPAFEAALAAGDATHALRLNPIKSGSPTLPAGFPGRVTRLPYAPDGYLYEGEKLGNTFWHHAGMIYLQDPSAMATVHALPIEKGWTVLDVCAAPGGKTSQLAAYVGEDGTVLANEYTGSRCRILQGNLERLGCRNTAVTHLDSADLAEWYPACFDLVLVDAPCSGEGMFRKNPNAGTEWSPENVTMCAERQRMILGNARRCVAPGGYLLYSTCTFAPEENEENVLWFLNENPDFSLCPVDGALQAVTAPGGQFADPILCPGRDGVDLSLTRRFYPHKAPGEGQFIALLKRAETGTRGRPAAKDGSTPLSRSENDLVNAFLKDMMTDPQALPAGRISRIGETVWWTPARLTLPPRGIVAGGVAIGEIRKGRIEPHHHFFSAFGRWIRGRLELAPEDPRLYEYLSGQEIACDPDLRGFCAVTVLGAPIGGVKAVGGRAKNHYPKGLRILSGSLPGNAADVDEEE